ncbi:sigma-70 family RNA polymerase sigma factor [soil metagenome]
MTELAATSDVAHSTETLGSGELELRLEQHRVELTAHAYRMLGSTFEAEDAVQETLLRAWRSFESFEGRATLRSWLYRIATNVCLDALAERAPRTRPMEMGPVGTVDDSLAELPRTHWLEPIPDVRALPADGDPHERAVLKESIRLAFVAALQHLPPRQRAALILTQVLNWSAAEVAGCLDISTAAVNSAIQRARATLVEKNLERHVVRSSPYAPTSLTTAQARLVERYVEAFEAYDVAALTALLREDATTSMPPYSLWLQGRESIGNWLSGRGIGCKDSILVPTEACGSPAFGQYRDHGATPWALIVLEIDDEAITSMNYFLDTKTLFPKFGLPAQVSAKLNG